MSTQPLYISNVRLIDPASGHDGPGAVLVRNGKIAEVSKGETPAAPDDAEIIDGGGHVLCPGLVDLRVKTGEPGNETKETLKSAQRAAAAGGVTSIVVQPDTDPVVDDPAMVGFILRRARDIGIVNVYPAGSATRELDGENMSEIGLMAEAGARYITDVDNAITDSKVMRRIMTYAAGFGMMLAHRPADPWLAKGAAVSASEFAGRYGLSSVPAVAERIMLERDIAIAEITGARLLVDQITCADALDRLKLAKDRGVNVVASASINHLSFNQLDVGDYRTFAKLDPPLRPESDRQALIEAVAGGLVDVVVSAHCPEPAESKRLPFDEAAPGSVGLETLLPGLVSLHQDGGPPLIDLLAAVTSKPAKLLNLKCGRIAKGAPADLILVDIGAPRLIDADTLLSKSKNSAFDGRRLQGEVKGTWVDGRKVFG